MIVERDTHKTLIGQSYSQSIATAISFSFTYRGRHKTLSPLILALQISPDVFTVLMYDYDHDYLIRVIFHWTRESLVYLWAVLHYRLFQRRSSDQLGLKPSGYANQSEQKKGLQGSYGSWKTWKVLENQNFKIQAWKTWKNEYRSWKVLENCLFLVQ